LASSGRWLGVLMVMWPTGKAFDRSEKRVVFGINHTSVAA
jgi:hypothetical protein